ncbi:hypothetical protein [Kribbella jiaozuonensis]|uniref:Uncharacterized protein n=1 Tax=Kribbella jiaozuonensis TaxID=2575441 RepID=A0A4V5UW68_9ACTN|nr:hypothetical protein [Kribbella jiaozuonensis]TKK74283.1 hypothetical protein FDA38_36450 [Kribbella jiaozuonensis]
MADRFDLDAIEADDALLDLLAAGGESARSAGEYDAAVQLLAELRLAVEVEDELPVETIDDPESFLARCAALNPITDPFARKMATRGLALGVAAVAALSVSGVAAAVNGDPLSPYEKVIEKMVDAVRPQTSFPKEDLDGLPVMDKTKIVKVGKDYKKQQVQAERAAQEAGKGGSLIVDPNSIDIKSTPTPVVEPTDKPMAILDKPTIPVPTGIKTNDPGNVNTDKPTDTKTDPPTDTTGGGDTDGTTTPTPPPSTPTDTPPPSTPTEPPPTTPTGTDTTTPPANVDTGTGDTTTGDPTSTPTGDTGQTDGTDGTGASGTSGSDTSTPGDEQKPSDPVTQVPDQKDPASIIGDILSPVLPTPTGEPVTIESAKLFFGESQAGKPPTAKKATAKKPASAKKAGAGKHSSGKVTTGSVRKAYPKGKHSTGQYPEGKHAAIERTHGSTADADVLAILNIVNAPVNK